MNTPPPVAKPVGIAVIGCGNFARRQHLPNLAALPTVRLRAVCDLDPALAADCAARFGADYGTPDAERLFTDPEVAAVVVAVRDEFQAALGVRAMEAGKHLYLEKPGGRTAAEFDRLIEARDRTGVRAAVGFNKPFAPAYRRAAALVAGAGGARMLYLRMSDDAWRWAVGYPPGSLLQHDLCHLFDLASRLLGAPVRSVLCRSPRPEDDALLLEFENGGAALILGSGNVTMDTPKERLEAITDRGAVVVDDFVELRTFGSAAARETFPGRAARPEDRPWVERLGNRGLEGWLEVRRELWESWRRDPDRPPIAIPNFLRDQGWFDSLAAFAEALRTQCAPPHATLEQAWHAAAVARAAERSRATGTVERVSAL